MVSKPDLINPCDKFIELSWMMIRSQLYAILEVSFGFYMNKVDWKFFRIVFKNFLMLVIWSFQSKNEVFLAVLWWDHERHKNEDKVIMVKFAVFLNVFHIVFESICKIFGMNCPFYVTNELFVFFYHFTCKASLFL